MFMRTLLHQNTNTQNTNSGRMEVSLRLAMSLFGLITVVVLVGSLNGLKERNQHTDNLTGPDFSAEASLVKCTLQGTPRQPAFSMDGDFVIGGTFLIHYQAQTVINNYTSKPELPICKGSFSGLGLQFSRTMVFAIEEINNSTELLPGVRLGYQIFDTCASVPVAVHAAFQLSNGQDPVFYQGSNCSKSGQVVAAVGDSGSTSSISVSRSFGSFKIPLVSYFSTCACLSDKHEHPTFFRTIPSDYYQAAALAKLVKHFGWTWIGAIHSDSDYGNNGMASFLDTALKEGICVEYIESFYRTDPQNKIRKVADAIRRSTAKVVLAFAPVGDMKVLLEELSREPTPHRQWIGSEAWISDPLLMSFSFCAGAFGVAIQQSVIPGLRDFLLDLSPAEVAASSVLTEFWEDAFNCSLTEAADPHKGKCDGTEDIKALKSPYTETSQLRVSNMVYKAVYAVAHAIHNAVCQETNGPTQCDKHKHLEPEQVFTELKKVNFSQNGYHVSFDANGDPVAFYELVNWQKSESGVIELVTVGYYDASLPRGQEFLINRNITWMDGYKQVPVSVCSESCPPGTRKVLQKGKPICCYDCIPCPEGEISNMTDSPDCFPCPREFWPNPKRDACFHKPVEFLSFDEVLSIILTVVSISGAFLAIITSVIFFHHRTTPIVRANNSELSFLLLFSLTLCFLCSLTFIGAPSEWSCMLRHTAFGITFVLCISCVLGKTIVVLMAFKATLPGSNAMKWFGPPQQRMTVVSFTFIQVIICIIWLVVSPPFPVKNLTTYKEKIILECALGSAVGFWAVLGYIGLLAVFCFVLAVLARKLPDNFNEAKMITFSMLIFCAVWITFIPAYVSSPGKFTVAVEIFAILASSFGLILCIFAPKCFIILFQPEKNTKKYLMNKN
ncbi:extracellular calcium-sensing receptor-like isoform X2 [Gambusia affinis]|uniref:extracellular calcium-sensing receptor-like isoform X2 n=1 Tax=Gambusia affinis TaxID=33528 RepID=UPI001CDC1CB9|nr:extracellular calcium-sensing receptor-like isoform X2 [Gambusia affinis]